MYVLLYRFDVLPAHREAFMRLAAEHGEECVASEPGTLRFEGVQDEADPGRFHGVEAYADREAFEAHRQAPTIRRNWGRFAPMLAAPTQPLGRGDGFFAFGELGR